MLVTTSGPFLTPVRPLLHRSAVGDAYTGSVASPALPGASGLKASPDWLTQDRLPQELQPGQWSVLSQGLPGGATAELAQWLASGLESDRSLVCEDVTAEHRCLELLSQIGKSQPELLGSVRLAGKPLAQGLTEKLLDESAPATEMVGYLRNRWMIQASRLIFPAATDTVQELVLEGYRRHGNLAAMEPRQQRALALWVTAMESGAEVQAEPLAAELKAEMLRRPREPLFMAVGNLLRDRQGATKLDIDESLELGHRVLAGARECDYREESLDVRHYLYHQLNTSDPIARYQRVQDLSQRVMPRLEAISHPQELSRQELAEVQMLGVLREQQATPKWNQEIDRLFNRDLEGHLLRGARAGLAVTQALYYREQLGSNELSPRQLVRSAQWMFRLSDTIPAWFVNDSVERCRTTLDRSREPWIQELRQRFPEVRQSVEVAAVVLDQADHNSEPQAEWKDFLKITAAAERSETGKKWELGELLGLYRKVKDLTLVSMSQEQALNTVLGQGTSPLDSGLEFQEDEVWIGSVPLELG